MNGDRAAIVGTGLIGGSIGLALREQGWWVCGTDTHQARAERALELGAIDEMGLAADVDVTFVATPVGAVPEVVGKVLAETRGFVSDVGSVKSPIAKAVNDPRFVPGHPMAGSERDGVDGARADMFHGAVWVLTPTESTADEAYAGVRALVSSLGAEPVALAPANHDALVSVVSHVPYLTAASLMHLAAERSQEHRALLRLAAGGFRDMTRIAASPPGMWPDICQENSAAILETLDRLVEALGEMREIVATDDRSRLVSLLNQARAARMHLPTTAGQPHELAEVRVPIPDRPGELARITTLATDVDVNIYNMEIAHSGESPHGILIMVVEAKLAERLQGALMVHNYWPSLHPLA